MKNLSLLFMLMLTAGANAFSQTTVTGNIYASTTWTATGSPYIIANNIVVFEGATLTIDPGVVVKCSDTVIIDLRGVLYAVGNSAHRIFFTSNKPSPAAGDY